MMKLNVNMNIQQVIEVFDHDTNEIKFYGEQNNEWIEITKEQYNQILEV